MTITKAVLNNGLKVANFSSPHPFVFEDGTSLGACSPERAKDLMLQAVETEVPNEGGWTDIGLEFRMTEAVASALDEVETDTDVQVLLVPLPVMTAIRSAGRPIGKARVIRVVDRVSKAISCNKFCV